jgi:hypothetical protein
LTELAKRELPKLLDDVAEEAGCPVRLLVLDPAGDFINGDENDLRFLDPKGVVVGLTAKGKAKSDTSGFVVG